MYDLPRLIPDVDVLLALQPQELAGRLLFLIRERLRRERSWRPHLNNCFGEPFANNSASHPKYPISRQDEVYVALAEAWMWLEAQGLLLPERGSNGTSGFRVLSRRAFQFVDERDFESFATALRLPREVLHSRIQDTVWQAFMRGEYDVAVFQAMKAVEVFVREVSNIQSHIVGVDLMRRAFHSDNGPLTDLSSLPAERQARSDLFAGAIGSYKNPHSHRDVALSDPDEAIEIVLLANHLIRIVHARATHLPTRE